jgi:hypothetical protein
MNIVQNFGGSENLDDSGFPIANRDARPLEITVSQRTAPRVIVDIRMTAD